MEKRAIVNKTQEPSNRHGANHDVKHERYRDSTSRDTNAFTDARLHTGKRRKHKIRCKTLHTN